ncbi:unnamed protein product [Pleuronectes platessa]|uniref:Uncharacterized protein n=1 Tax=Pleuronectes platessa TaxID=8262 RepID=A0A9N7YV37_PLEPL|nr:unnamed protein product [Pleuronectes platessa]
MRCKSPRSATFHAVQTLRVTALPRISCGSFRNKQTEATRFSMRWFGFGFNAFGQICDRGRLSEAAGSDVTEEIKVLRPTELDSCCCSKISGVRASWSRRATVHEDGDSCVCVAGFDAASSSQSCGVSLSLGCKDASISEQHLTLAFPDRIESWDLQRKDRLHHGARKQTPNRRAALVVHS